MNRSRFLILLIIFSLISVVGSIYLLNREMKTGSVLSAVKNSKSAFLFFEGDKRVAVNQQFKLRVKMNTGNQNVNAVGLFIRFDKDKLQVNDMNTLNSFCQFYPEKKFDNRYGLISLSCGSPHPGFKGENDIVELTMMPLSMGTTVMQITDGSKLLLSDGKGTNLLDAFPSWEVQIGADL